MIARRRRLPYRPIADPRPLLRPGTIEETIRALGKGRAVRVEITPAWGIDVGVRIMAIEQRLRTVEPR